MRPSKTRIVSQLPKCQKFKAVENEEDAKPSTSECVTIGLDLLEAMRLVDAEGQSQEEAAQRMQVSTPTLCRMLGEGRKLAAEALSLGKTILLQGGNIMYQHHHQHGHGPMHGAAHGAKSCEARGHGARARENCSNLSPQDHILASKHGHGHGHGREHGETQGHGQAYSGTAVKTN